MYEFCILKTCNHFFICFLGGMDSIVSLSMNKYHSGLVGCLANVTLSTDYHIRLITHATTGINIQPCL